MIKFLLILSLTLISFQSFSFNLFHHELPQLNTIIGTKTFTRIDNTRKDSHSKDSIFRELVYRIWYPAINDKSVPFSLWGYENRDLIIENESKASGIPTLILNYAHLNQVRSKINLNPLPGSYPIIFLLKGLGPSQIEEQTDIAEFLVSRGFIVIGISMPYAAGSLKISQVKYLIPYSEEIQEILSRYPASKPELISYRLKEHDLWVQDVIFSFKILSSKTEPRLEYANWNKIHILGHSHGGVVAMDACLKINQCISSVNLDGFTYNFPIPHDLKKHLAYYVPSSGDYMRTYCKNKLGCNNIEISCDIGHSGFSDAIYSKWPFTYFTKNNCGDESVHFKQQINVGVADFFTY